MKELSDKLVFTLQHEDAGFLISICFRFIKRTEHWLCQL